MRRRRTLRTIGAAAAAAVLLVASASALVLYPQIWKRLPDPAYPPAQSAAEANAQDLDYLDRLIEVDRSFAPEARAAFAADIAALKNRAGSLSAAQFEMEAARLVALAGNGHTNVKGVGRGLTLNALPIRIGRFEEGYFVVRARPELAELVGARLLTIDGEPPETYVQALASFVGGESSLQRQYATFMLVSPQALNAAGLAEQGDRSIFTLVLADGGEITRVLVAEDFPANGPARDDPGLENLRRNRWPQRDLSPVASPLDIGEWITVLDADGSLPLFLTNPERHYWSTEIAALDAIYLQINRVRSQGQGLSLQAFLDGVLKALDEAPVRNAIIDLRFNAGGDHTLIAGFTEALPGALPADGRIFVLTSGNTFSAALSMTARLKYFGRDRALIVGEPMGDREQFWSEGDNIILPNSGLQIGYATAFHDWESGCSLRQLFSCHYVNYFLGVPAGRLVPDISAAPRFADYARGIDTALEVVATMIHTRS